MANESFYNSVLWQVIRQRKLAANPICECCHTQRATDVDHIRAIRSGGHPTAWGNLQSLCSECHGIKTFYMDTNH
jgi:5-methylcytosine-specific restriction endonuclease McrA